MNIKLQVRKQNTSQLFGHVDGFRNKLLFYKTSLEKMRQSISLCREIANEGKPVVFAAFAKKNRDISKQHNDIIADVDLVKQRQI